MRGRRCRDGSNPEGFATTATITLVGVVEFEALLQAFAHEVELSAVEITQALGVDQHLDAMALEHPIVRGDSIGIFQLVSQAAKGDLA